MQTQRKKITLAAIAVLLPAIMLALLLGRFLRQQSDLEALRRTAAVSQAARDIGGSMAIRLELLALEHLGRHWETPEAAVRPGAPVSIIIDDTDVGPRLPWSSQGKAISDLTHARGLEFGGRLGDAERQYRRLQSDPSTEVQAASTLGLARVVGRSGRTQEAGAAWAKLLATPLGIVDDLGIPYALYAARQLGDWSQVIAGFTKGAALSPTAVAMLRSGLTADGLSLPPDLGGWTTEALWAEQIVAAWDDLQFRLDARPDEWVSLDGRLVRAVQSNDGRRSVVAIRAEPVFRQAASALGLNGSELREEGVSIDPFDGLSAHIVLPATRAGGQDRRFVSLVVLLAIVLPLMAGVLLWREVRRDRELVATRANFVASVSHEMRTPLTTIGVFGESLLNGWISDEQQEREYLETIVSESARLGRLIGNVLDLSAIERGVRSYRMELTDLRIPVEAACRAVEVAAEDKDIGLVCRANSVKTVADKDAMEQAVINLVSNSVKFSPNGSRIEVRLERIGEDARITVADDGPGIDAVNQKRIFEAFYRGPQAEGVVGAGIGLSVTRHIAAAHKGSLEVQSETGKGSRFILTVPVGSI